MENWLFVSPGQMDSAHLLKRVATPVRNSGALPSHRHCVVVHRCPPTLPPRIPILIKSLLVSHWLTWTNMEQLSCECTLNFPTPFLGVSLPIRSFLKTTVRPSVGMLFFDADVSDPDGSVMHDPDTNMDLASADAGNGV